MRKRTYGINPERKKLISIKKEDGNFQWHEIRSKNDSPIWNLFKDYINSLDLNQRFTRGEMLYAVYDEKLVPELRGFNNTADTYRSYLRKLGIIVHIKAGIYEKKMHVPKNITLIKIINAGREMSKWKGWFIPLHNLLDVDESELK